MNSDSQTLLEVVTWHTSKESLVYARGQITGWAEIQLAKSRPSLGPKRIYDNDDDENEAVVKTRPAC